MYVAGRRRSSAGVGPPKSSALLADKDGIDLSIGIVLGTVKMHMRDVFSRYVYPNNTAAHTDEHAAETTVPVFTPEKESALSAQVRIVLVMRNMVLCVVSALI